MAHLSSCYFCGSALETPVETYELGGSETTITLCRSCKEKLEPVMGAVGAAPPTPVTTPGSVTTDQQHDREDNTPSSETAGAVTAPDDTAGTDSDTADEEPPTQPADEDGETANDDPTRETPSGETPFEDELSSFEKEQTAVDEPTTVTEETATETTTVESEPTVEETAAVEESVDSLESTRDTTQTADTDDVEKEDDLPEDSELEPELGDDSAGVDIDDPLEGEELFSEDDQLEDEEPLATGTDDQIEDESLAGDSPDADSGMSEEVTENETGDGEETKRPSSESTESGDQESTDSERSAGDQESEPETSETEHDTPSETTISALEYNRVMRMLQNRAFPVDRAEIEVVAANAYDLAESECAQVIDLAVDRGLLEERDGELYRPDD